MHAEFTPNKIWTQDFETYGPMSRQQYMARFSPETLDVTIASSLSSRLGSSGIRASHDVWYISGLLELASAKQEIVYSLSWIASVDFISSTGRTISIFCIWQYSPERENIWTDSDMWPTYQCTNLDVDMWLTCRRYVTNMSTPYWS